MTIVVKRVQATVSGHVQGVGFRYFAVHAAHRLGISGTVRNLPNGDVEVIGEAEEPVLNEFLGELRQGPSSAHVEDVQTAWGDPEDRMSGFTAVS